MRCTCRSHSAAEIEETYGHVMHTMTISGARSRYVQHGLRISNLPTITAAPTEHRSSEASIRTSQREANSWRSSGAATSGSFSEATLVGRAGGESATTSCPVRASCSGTSAVLTVLADHSWSWRGLVGASLRRHDVGCRVAPPCRAPWIPASTPRDLEEDANGPLRSCSVVEVSWGLAASLYVGLAIGCY